MGGETRGRLFRQFLVHAIARGQYEAHFAELRQRLVNLFLTQEAKLRQHGDERQTVLRCLTARALDL